jgi:uncharacterized membrane protein HdeD (DUF308 family)
MKNNIILTLVSLLCSGILFAQNGVQQQTTMAETMRSNGKIYVVVAVILTILFGLIAYLVRLDKKISHIEREK